MPDPSEPQKLFLHIGLPKSGTTFLQELLAGNRELLREAGSCYPFVRPEAMFQAAVELRGQHDLWGLDPGRIDGTWSLLLERVRATGLSGVVSHEILAGSVGKQIDRVAADTTDLELHVVVTARDLARQATAHWQEEVKNGRPWSFAEFERELFGPGEAEDQELGFWRSQDLLSVLRRWGAVVPPERVHVVVVPPAGTDRLELWRRFAPAVGIDPTLLEERLPEPRNESLGVAQIALLRQVVAELDGRLGQPHYAHVVKRFFAQRLLGGADSERPQAPPALRVQLTELSSGWPAELRSRGYRLYGDPGELVPRAPDGPARHPDEVSAEEVLEDVPRVLAELLVEVAELRAGAEGAGALPPLTPVAEQDPSSSEESAWRRIARRSARRLGK